MRCPVLVMACGFALGIALAPPAPVFLWLGVLVLLAGAAALRMGWVRTAGALAILGFVFAGAVAHLVFQRRFPPNHVSHLGAWGLNLEHPVLLRGRLAADSLRTPYGIQFDLETRSVSDGTITRTASGKIRMRVMNGGHSPLPAAALGLHYGEWISVRAKLQRPRNYRNPGAFDYRRWMETIHDIYWQGIAAGPSEVSLIPGPAPPITGRLIAGAREHLLAGIDRMYPPWSVRGRDGAVLKAILLGDRSSLDSETVEGFRKSGLYHLLVVAGLHVGLLALLAEGLLRLLGFGERWRTVFLLLFLATFSLLVEQRAPTLRASLMIGFYLLARLFDRSQPALNAIGIAALTLLAWRPAWLFESGFQLSFAAALLIAGLAIPLLDVLTEPYRRALAGLEDPGRDFAFEPQIAQFRLDARALAGWLAGQKNPSSIRQGRAVAAVSGTLRFLIWLVDLVIFSAILQLGLLLPMTEIFHRVTLAGIGLNTLAVPLMTVLLAVAVPVVLLNLISPALAALPAKLLALIMEGLFKLT
ncbi:MAG: ComEC family competence protein, partial [Acidobacteriota bacterium]|nr:ComEC family competence protein [Acidobacteriota bacterium]